MNGSTGPSRTFVQLATSRVAKCTEIGRWRTRLARRPSLDRREPMRVGWWRVCGTAVPTTDWSPRRCRTLCRSGTEHGDLAGALRALSPELRAVVQATVLDGLTTREAGRYLGIPAGTVKTRMMRARAELRGALT